jgi:hypothetical protein
MSGVIQDDCLKVMPTLVDKSVDASITVPAYALWLAGTWIVALFLVLNINKLPGR